MARANGKKIIKKTGLIMAAILAVTGVASLLAWGTFGYTDWTFGNWRSAAPEELPAAPAEELTDEEPQSYAFAVSARTVAATPRVTSAGLPDLWDDDNAVLLNGKDYTLTIAANLSDDMFSIGKPSCLFMTKYIPLNSYVDRKFACIVGNPFPVQGYYVESIKVTYNFQATNSPSCFSTTTTLTHGGNSYYPYISEEFTVTHDNFSQRELRISIYITYAQITQPLPPAPQKEGYTFTGWYYGTEAEHGENCTKYIGETVTSNINLHAHFEINRFTVTFNTDGGNNIENQVVDWNSSITPPTPEKRGYEFQGWFLEDGTEYTGQAIKQDTTLKAHWEIKTFTVTFYVGGEVYATKEVDYGTTFAEMAEEAKDLNLRVLSVMTEHGEQPIEYFADNRITDDYSVVSDKLSAREIAVNTLQKYPWIIFAGGGALSVLVGIVGVVASIVQTRKPARRRRR